MPFTEKQKTGGGAGLRGLSGVPAWNFKFEISIVDTQVRYEGTVEYAGLERSVVDI